MQNKLNILNKYKSLVFLIPIALGLCSVEALAAFDIDKAGTAIADPIKTGITKYVGVAIFASGLLGMFFATGDLRTRAFGFGIGAGAAGLFVAGVKAGFGL